MKEMSTNSTYATKAYEWERSQINVFNVSGISASLFVTYHLTPFIY